jgi:hypothetical protein
MEEIFYVERWGNNIYIMKNHHTGKYNEYDYYKIDGKNYRVEKCITYKELKNAISQNS